MRGIQLLPYPHVVAAVKMAQRELGEVTIVGTGEVEADIEVLSELGAEAMLLHGKLTDRKRADLIGRALDEIRAAGSAAGVTTHRPRSTLSWLRGTGLETDVVMLPFNKQGRFMDADDHEEGPSGGIP